MEMILLTGIKKNFTWVSCNLRWWQKVTTGISSHDVPVFVQCHQDKWPTMVAFGCYYPPSFAVKAQVFQTKYEEVGDFKEDRESLVSIP